MKITVITVVLNAVDTIGDTLRSVAEQTYSNVEHIVIDGVSTDGTLALLQDSPAIDKLVSEPDNGLYDAMNKGIALASGDVIGFLNADDVYANERVLERVAEVHQDDRLDACYADLVYVKSDDLSHVVRNWRSQPHYSTLCWDGWMPAHPTLYMKKRALNRVGGFDTQLKYQSDLEFCARAFEVHKISSRYVPELWVRMRLGGVTNRSLGTILAGNWESYKALKKLGLNRNPVRYFSVKFASRVKQFF